MARRNLIGSWIDDVLNADARLGMAVPAEVVGGWGQDTLTGGSGSDKLRGGLQGDLLVGGGGEDWLFGGAGDDTLISGDGSAMRGGDGDDTLVVRAGHAAGARNNRVFGGSGHDTLVLRLSDAQAADAGMMAEIARVRAFIDSAPGDDDFLVSRELGVRVQQVEALVVQVDHAPASLAPVRLADLAANHGGFAIRGTTTGYFGAVAVAAGDVNGDGHGDLVLGDTSYDNGTATDAGRVYVVFGKADTATVTTAQLEAGLGGYVLTGSTRAGQAGFNLAGLGDLNGDGLADIGIGAPFITIGGQHWAGATYVAWGQAATDAIDLGSLSADGNGYRISGAAAQARLGVSMANVGDMNGDGIPDLALYTSDWVDSAGGATVVVGKGSAAGVPLSALTAARGFTIHGIVGSPPLRLAAAGDINGDGLADLVLGKADLSTGLGENPAAAWVVFGSTHPQAVELGALGSHGFAVAGMGYDTSNYSVAGPGDVNGDGIDDLLIGLGIHPAPGGYASDGEAWVLFGHRGTAPYRLADAGAGIGGFHIKGEAGLSGAAGYEVAAVGDVNGDGLADMLISAPQGAFHGDGFGYLVFGRTGTAEVRLSDVAAGIGGVKILGGPGEAVADVLPAGDVNADGLADVLVATYSGAAYVVYGSSNWLV